jgi:hypothetical protein
LGHRGGAARRIPARPAARLAGEVGNNDRELTTGLLVVDLGSGRLRRGDPTEAGGGDRGEDCSGELLAGEHTRVAREASRCPRERDRRVGYHQEWAEDGAQGGGLTMAAGGARRGVRRQHARLVSFGP